MQGSVYMLRAVSPPALERGDEMLVSYFIILWWWILKCASFKAILNLSFLSCWWSLLARILIVVLRTPLERDYVGLAENVLNFVPPPAPAQHSLNFSEPVTSWNRLRASKVARELSQKIPCLPTGHAMPPQSCSCGSLEIAWKEIH